MEKESTPLVSIGIPVYNAESTIKETIQCIIEQTYQNWELIICDNCSTDNTVKIIEQFSDKRIRFYRNDENIGMLENFKKVAKLSEGEYYKLLCADDLISTDCLEKQVAVFIADVDKRIAIVTCDIDIIDGNGKLVMKRKIPLKGNIVTYKKVVNYFLRTSRGSIIEAFQILTRRNLYLQEMLSQSSNYIAKEAYCMLLYGDLYIIRETLGSYRLKKGSMTTQVAQAKLQCIEAKRFYNDKRFNVSFLQYIQACIMAYPVSFARRLAFLFYAK